MLKNVYGFSRTAQRAACLLLCMGGTAIAAPVIEGTSGTFDHKSSLSISGSGFGTKSKPAPAIWDDASGTDLGNLWSGALPNCGTQDYRIAYRAPIRGINLPHNNITKYIAGAHGDKGWGGSCGGYGGPMVDLWKTFNVTSYPMYAYVSWYYRMDDRWSFGQDDNLKDFAFSTGNGMYNMPDNWYFDRKNLVSRSSTPQWTTNDDSNFQSMMRVDMNGHNNWWGTGYNPMGGQWIKMEVELKITNQTNGFLRLRENGKLSINYVGSTDKYAGTQRTIGIGGFARQSGFPDNWRYFADVYFDFSLARVVLANNANLAQATVIEPQIPSNWTNDSITVRVNQGKFTDGQTAYLFVVDANGQSNAAGRPVTIGGGEARLSPPTNLRVISVN